MASESQKEKKKQVSAYLRQSFYCLLLSIFDKCLSEMISIEIDKVNQRHF